AAKIARAIAMNMLNEGTQWRLDPRYILILCDAVEGSSLPAPDDGLVEKLLEAAEDWRRLSDPENEELTLSAATAIQSKDEQIERWRQNSIDTWSAVFAEIERLTRERDVALEN